MTDATTKTGWVLAFDASTPLTVLALGRADETAPRWVDADDDGGANQASARLEARVRALLDDASLAPTDLELVACGRGPGTFTGSRVAVAFAKGLALGLGRPVVGVSTLAAVAASGETSGTVLALLDARRGELYAGRFEVTDTQVHPLDEERLMPVGAATPALGKALGPGVPPALEAGSTLAPDSLVLAGPSGLGLWRATLSAIARAEIVSAHELGVVYLRASHAEMGLNRPKRPVFRSPFLD